MIKISMPNRSIIQCGLAAFASLLLMSWLRIRPLGILFVAIYGFWFYRTRCSYRIVPPPELQTKLEQFSLRLTTWRQNRPTMFCVVTSGCLGALAVLGHLISGSTVVIAGLVLAAILSTNFHFKIEHKNFAWSEKLNHDNELDDEFMPDENETNLFVLERASDLATISSPIDADDEEEEEKSDEIPSELLIPDIIPEIDENSSSDEEHNDLVPIARREDNSKTAQQLQQHHHTEPSQSTNISCQQQLLSEAQRQQQQEHAHDIEFRKGHFKRDSSLSTTSSSSEESLSKGLKFPDHTMVDGPTTSIRQLTDASQQQQHNQMASDVVAMAVKTQTQALLANSGKILPNLVTGLVQWGMSASSRPNASDAAQQRRIVTALDSSDESDFEILETDDFK